MTITISNDSASVLARDYAHTEQQRIGKAGAIIWLEIAPQHLMLPGAIWALIVSSHYSYL